MTDITTLKQCESHIQQAERKIITTTTLIDMGGSVVEHKERLPVIRENLEKALAYLNDFEIELIKEMDDGDL